MIVIGVEWHKIVLLLTPKGDCHSNNHLNLRNPQYETVLDKASMNSANTAKCLILWVTPMKLDLVANLPDVFLVPKD